MRSINITKQNKFECLPPNKVSGFGYHQWTKVAAANANVYNVFYFFAV